MQKAQFKSVSEKYELLKSEKQTLFLTETRLKMENANLSARV